MTNLNEALEEISAIRTQIARGTEFRGYGPASVAASGVIALVCGGASGPLAENSEPRLSQLLCDLDRRRRDLSHFDGHRDGAAHQARSSSFANEMIYHAAEQFLPALTAGLLLTVVVIRVAPHSVWMLPGLWQVVFSLGVFASCQFLPRQMFLVGMWYLAAGLICLAVSRDDGTFSPWVMGVPFGIGQLLVAAVLQFGYREAHERT